MQQRNKDNLGATSLAWKKIAFMWDKYFTSPSRISKEETSQYRKWLDEMNRDRKHQKALVLGATPEIRDALSDFGYDTTSLDINNDMFLAMDNLLKSKNPDEKLIVGNWLASNLPDKSFDVILGDAVLPNIPWDQRENLLSEIKRLLKPSGIFLTRSFCVPNKKLFESVEEIFNYFSKIDEPLNQLALEMVLELQILAYDKNDHLGSFTKAKDLLEKYHNQKGDEFENEKIQKVHDIVWNFWCKDFIGKVFIYNSRKDEEDEYKSFFEISEFFEAKDHNYSKITPMYFLKVKE